jgi:hypothetical protein
MKYSLFFFKKLIMQNMTIERLEKLQELDDQRLKTMASKAFQQWANSLGVSKMYFDPEPLFNAKQMNADYDFSKPGMVDKLKKALSL